MRAETGAALSASLAAATAALGRTMPSADSLFPLTLARARRERGLPAGGETILAGWTDQKTSTIGSTRYPWVISSWLTAAYPPDIGGPDWLPWRPGDVEAIRENRAAFEAGLLVPLVLAATAEELAVLAEGDSPDAERARRLLRANRTKLRRDFALYVLERHAWADTWALWCLARHPRALALLNPFAIVIASAYAERARADGGLLRETRFPFHGARLASATAQLAAGLVALGTELDLAGALTERLRADQRPDGGWGDAGGSSDVLTTFVAADLLAALDPIWDPAAACEFLVRCQRASGWWQAYGPEAVWLTEALTRLLESCGRPFAERFRPPGLAPSVIDGRTSLPRYEHYRAIADLAGAVGGLADARFSVAFMDLIGFRAFNNELGMAEGDAALALFAECLATIPATIAIRDGGDEFLLVVAPGMAGGSSGFRQVMEEFLRRWERAFRTCFGTSAPAVAPRILVGHAPGRDLVSLRNRLGRQIGGMKLRGGPIRGFVEALEP